MKTESYRNELLYKWKWKWNCTLYTLHSTLCTQHSVQVARIDVKAWGYKIDGAVRRLKNKYFMWGLKLRCYRLGLAFIVFIHLRQNIYTFIKLWYNFFLQYVVLIIFLIGVFNRNKDIPIATGYSGICVVKCFSSTIVQIWKTL